MTHSSTSQAPRLEEVKPNSFIYEIPGALDGAFCRAVIRRFEDCPGHQRAGRIGQTGTEDGGVKKTTDLTVSDKPDWKDVDQALFRSLAATMKAVREVYPFFRGAFKDMGYGIQRYHAGEYYHWHIDGGSHDFSYRQLVALWYLNDVPGPGGETEFRFQDVRVRPEEGKLVIFPPFWTHEHRSVTLEQGVKYIATTWVVFA